MSYAGCLYQRDETPGGCRLWSGSERPSALLVVPQICEHLPTDDELVRKIGPEYAALVPIVRKQVPEEYRMVIAHKCSYGGRKFVHLSLRNDENLLSVVITQKQNGESFPQDGALPESVRGVALHAARVDRFQISGFESAGQLVS